MLPALVPSPEQLSAIWRMAYEPTCAALNTSGLGTGKTMMALEVAKVRGADVLLIIAPLGTRLGWKVTAQRQGMDHDFYWIKTDKNKDDYLSKLKTRQKGIYFIGIEYFVRLGWNGKTRDKLWSLVYPDFIVVDESHKASNRSTKTYKTLNLMTGDNFLKGGFKIGQSATPSGNKFEGAWAVPRWLWPDDDVAPRSYHLWVGRWAKTEYDPFSFSHKKVVGEKVSGAWYDSLPCHVHIEAPEHDIVREERYIELTPRQRKIYDDLEDQYLAWLGDNPLNVELPITLQLRQNQTTLAEPIINDDGDVDFSETSKSSTVDEILTIIKDEIDEESALIYSNSRKFNQNVVIPKLRKAGYSVEGYDGSVPHGEREEIKKRFISGETKYLVVVIAAGGTGIDGFQHATRNVIWANKDLNGVNNEQASGRVARQGQTRTVREFTIVAINTRMEGSYKSLADQEIERRRSLVGEVV